MEGKWRGWKGKGNFVTRRFVILDRCEFETMQLAGRQISLKRGR